jgi:predicted kinase
MLVIMAGLPGTGKSTLARTLAERTGAVVLDKDSLRAALFPPAFVEYSREQDDFVVRVMLKVAGWIVRREPGATVILDGRPFAKKYQLDQVVAFAEWIKTPWRIVECSCSEETARARLEGEMHPAADRDFKLYQRVISEWEEITRAKLVLNTERPVDELFAECAGYLGLTGQSKSPAHAR